MINFFHFCRQLSWILIKSFSKKLVMHLWKKVMWNINGNRHMMTVKLKEKIKLADTIFFNSVKIFNRKLLQIQYLFQISMELVDDIRKSLRHSSGFSLKFDLCFIQMWTAEIPQLAPRKKDSRLRWRIPGNLPQELILLRGLRSILISRNQN